MIGVVLVVSSIRTMMKPDPEEAPMPEEAEEVQTGEQRHEVSASTEELRSKENSSMGLQKEETLKEKTEIKENE